MAVITQEKTQGQGTAAVSRCRSLRENNKLIPWNPGRLGSQARLRACADQGDPAVQTPPVPNGAVAYRARLQSFCLELFVIVPCVSILPS